MEEYDCTQALVDSLSGEDSEEIEAALAEWEPGGETASIHPLVACVISKKYEYVIPILGKMKNSRNSHDERALSKALLIAAGEPERDNFFIVKVLLAAGADVNFHDDMMWTPLMKAALNSPNLKILDLLSIWGADIHHVSKPLGITALMAGSARKDKNPCFAKLLLKDGADKNLKTADGLSALKIARRKGNKEVVRLLSPIPDIMKYLKKMSMQAAVLILSLVIGALAQNVDAKNKDWDYPAYHGKKLSILEEEHRKAGSKLPDEVGRNSLSRLESYDRNLPTIAEKSGLEKEVILNRSFPDPSRLRDDDIAERYGVALKEGRAAEMDDVKNWLETRPNFYLTFMDNLDTGMWQQLSPTDNASLEKVKNYLPDKTMDEIAEKLWNEESSTSGADHK